MASTSTSSIRKSFKYDVFLSFRGEDTRNNFVSHLYKALEQNGIQTYKDDEKIKKGETIDTQLMESIEDSRFFIILFSKNYASSSWCLDELVKIMECQKTTEQTAYPVFYDVEPTEVRKQIGAVEGAFKEHSINKAAAGKWKLALKEAADLAGWELKKTANGDESKLIQIVVDDIFKNICLFCSSFDEKLVGMEMRINEILSSLEMGTKDVRMIGIKGIGGGGKTTLATAIFNQISHQFEGSSFVENVREVSKNSLSGLKELQKQILTDIFSNQDITVSSVSGGINKMTQMMWRKKVLVVLDDVDSAVQLEALAGDLNWYKPGSRIIITTRDEQVLLVHRVSFINNVTLLSHTEAIRLFNRYAFTKKTPIQEHEELSRQVVKYADGLPLTIKVLGSLLCGQNEPQWKDALERLKTIPLKETMKILELSYDALEEDYKEIFLDVACLLKGWEQKDAIRVLESRGFHAIYGLTVLEQKSLITISERGRVGMHDHIEELGKNIVRRLYPNSRLWIQEEIEEILANESGTQATNCITLDTYGFNLKILMNGLRNMKELRFLRVGSLFISEGEVSKWNFDEDSLHLPNALRFLRWDNYPFSSLPKTFQPKDLVGLDMCHSNIVQLWEDGEEKACLKLRFLKFTYSKLRTLDLSVAPNFETLILDYCYNLVEVHFQVTPNLKELYIFRCYKLEKLHMPSECPKLVNLHLSNLKLRTLDLSVAPNLETLILEYCYNLVEVHFQATPNLKELCIFRCYKLEKLHMPSECPKLVNLHLSNLKLRTLHLGITPNLETLRLSNCTDMVELRMPAECPKLVNLKFRDLKLKTLHLGITPNLETLSLSDCTDVVELRMPVECPKLVTFLLNENTKLRTLDLGLTPNLQWLYLANCYDLEEINAPAECLKKLLYLHISHCGRFKSFKFDKELDSPEVVSLSELHLMIADTGNLGNAWPEFQFSCYYKEDRASSFGNLERLISLGFSARINVDSFSDIICGLQCLRKLTLEGGIPEAPKDLDQLDCLEELSLRSTDIKNLPDSLCMLKHLKSLEIISCRLLEKLPEDIGRLQCLEKLIVKDCIRIEELPEEIRCLENLKELDIAGTSITRLPKCLYDMKGLKIRGPPRFLDHVHDDANDDDVEDVDEDGDDDK